ncbi:MAG: hypothetical protein NTZ09_02435 [Candidatus Hydrogenedentes bacterium]|nr:hypothetical protein [Candidatus Hydrogenedentota bacterium]
MDKKGSGTAWAIAGLAVVALIGSLVWGFSLHQRVQALNQTVTDSQQQANALKNQAQQQDEQVRRLQETVGQLEQRLAATTPENAAAPDGAAAPGETPAEAPKPAENANPMASMMKMFEGEQGKKFAEASANAAMTMQYGDLFTELALPPETEQKVRGIIRDYMVRAMQASAEFMKSDATPESAKKFEDDFEAQMRTELSKVLTNEGMAIFDEYEAGAPERMLRKSFEMQMGMFAPGLTEENRTMVIDVMVEEMMALKQEPGSLATMADPNAIGAQLDALERSRQRLSTVLEEQQMTQVDGFIQQTRMGIEMFQQMMSSRNKPADQQEKP